MQVVVLGSWLFVINSCVCMDIVTCWESERVISHS